MVEAWKRAPDAETALGVLRLASKSLKQDEDFWLDLVKLNPAKALVCSDLSSG